MARRLPTTDQLAEQLLDSVKANSLGRYRMRFFKGGTVIVNADTKPAKKKVRRGK